MNGLFDVGYGHKALIVGGKFNPVEGASRGQSVSDILRAPVCAVNTIKTMHVGVIGNCFRSALVTIRN
jgi:hypothetical protein